MIFFEDLISGQFLTTKPETLMNFKAVSMRAPRGRRLSRDTVMGGSHVRFSLEDQGRIRLLWGARMALGGCHETFSLRKFTIYTELQHQGFEGNFGREKQRFKPWSSLG